MQITFTIPGTPKGKGRPRFARMGNFVKTYTPKETASYENLVKVMFLQAADKQGWQKVPSGVPVTASMLCFFEIPASWSKKKRAAAQKVTKKPDADNIIKIVSDALNGLAYDDDSQIAMATVNKVYAHFGEQIGVTVTLTAEEPK